MSEGQQLEKAGPRELVLRPQVGLMLSIGEPPTEGRNYPRKLDHFRPKPGTENQYAEAVTRFAEKYGEKPKELDIVLLSNAIGDVLDIRWKAWGQSGLKAIGQTNYATCPDRMFAADDTLTVFPDDSPDAFEYAMAGPDDPNILKTGTKLYGVFRFALPGVTGLNTLAEISTTSKRSMKNLLAGLSQNLALTSGHLAGIPLVLAVRPTRSRYFDEKKKKRSSTTFFELILDTRLPLDEFFQQVDLRRRQMASGPLLELPPVDHADAERDRELDASLWQSAQERRVAQRVEGMPLPDEEDVRTREEPTTIERPSDAQLNRIAALEERLGGTPHDFLLGAYGVQSAEGLSATMAEQYEKGLARLVDEQNPGTVEAEVTSDGEGSFPIPADVQQQLGVEGE